jgi:hypothetical protein
MAKSDSNENWQTKASTTGGFGGLNQNLNTGLMEDSEGNVVVPEVRVPDGAEIVQQDQIGAFRRTVFSNGAVETIQTEPAEPSGEIQTPVPLPGESQDVTGTRQDEAYKPKTAPGAKTGKAAQKAADK